MLSNFRIFSESYLADLGRVIAGWSVIEHQHFDPLFLSLVVMRGEASGIVLKDAARRKTMKLAFPARIGLLKKRIKELGLPNEKQNHIEQTLDQLSECQKDRNEITQSMISPTIKGNQIFSDEALSASKSWNNSNEFEFKSLTQEHLRVMFQRLNALSLDLVNLALDEELRQANQKGPELSNEPRGRRASDR